MFACLRTSAHPTPPDTAMAGTRVRHAVQCRTRRSLDGVIEAASHHSARRISLDALENARRRPLRLNRLHAFGFPPTVAGWQRAIGLLETPHHGLIICYVTLTLAIFTTTDARTMSIVKSTDRMSTPSILIFPFIQRAIDYVLHECERMKHAARRSRDAALCIALPYHLEGQAPDYAAFPTGLWPLGVPSSDPRPASPQSTQMRHSVDGAVPFNSLDRRSGSGGTTQRTSPLVTSLTSVEDAPIALSRWDTVQTLPSYCASDGDPLIEDADSPPPYTPSPGHVRSMIDSLLYLDPPLSPTHSTSSASSRRTWPSAIDDRRASENGEFAAHWLRVHRT